MDIYIYYNDINQLGFLDSGMTPDIKAQDLFPLFRNLFTGMPRQTIEILVDKLRPDFELCGYQKSLALILEQL